MISIHALREEGDGVFSLCAEIIKLFLSTPSARRATDVTSNILFESVISIHALREEGDFNMVFYILSVLLFLSTPSARRATRPT